MPKNQTDLQLKKQAFRTTIRRQWLHQHFKQIRTAITQNENAEDLNQAGIKEALKRLPGSIIEIVDMMQDGEKQKHVTVGVVESIRQIAEKMVRLQAVAWSNYLYILEKVFEGPFKISQLQKVTSHTLLSVLECGQILARKHEHSPAIYCQILNHCLDYCFRASMFITNLDGLQQSALISILTRLWSGHELLESYQKLLYVCNSVICRNEQEQCGVEDVDQQHKIVMQFIFMVFYSRKAENMKILIGRLIDNVVLFKDVTTNKLSLQLLVNITNGTFNSIFYYPLLENNIIHVINTNLIYYKEDKEIIILTIRLLNNMVVNDQTLTQQIFSEITLFCLMDLYRANESEVGVGVGVGVQVDLVDLFINVLHFMNEDEEFIRQMVNKDVHTIILQFISKIERCDDNLINQALTSLMIALNCHPLVMRQSIKHYRQPLERLVADNSSINKVGAQLLKFIYEYGEIGQTNDSLSLQI